MRNLKRSGYSFGSLAALSVSCLLGVVGVAQAATINVDFNVSNVSVTGTYVGTAAAPDSEDIKRT